MLEFIRRCAARDLDGLAALHADDYLSVDHRTLGWEDLHPDTRRPLWESFLTMAADLSVEMDEVLACDDRLTAAATASLRTLLRPPPISVAVPNTAIDSNGSKVGAVIGGILGSILTLHIGVGTAIGAAAGGAIGGGSEAKAALDKDRSAAIANLTAAGEAAAAHFRALPATILSQVTDARATPSALPPSPDRTGLDALAALHTHLTSTLAAMARAAVTEAEQAMTQ
jgi:hypothetical protein